MTKPIKAELSLQRSNQDHKTISLRLRFGTGKTVTVGMKPYDFALMVTGMSDVDCQVELRNVRLEMESQFRLVLREEQPDCDCTEDDTSSDREVLHELGCAVVAYGKRFKGVTWEAM